MDEDEIAQLKDVFVSLDANGDGILTSSELKAGIEQAGLKEIPEHIREIMQEFDDDNGGEIDYTEFLAATMDRRVYLQEDVCRKAFIFFDRDGDGKLSPDEVQAVLGDGGVKSMCAEAIAEMMRDTDTNHDGMIDFEEFMQMMRRRSETSSMSPQQWGLSTELQSWRTSPHSSTGLRSWKTTTNRPNLNSDAIP